MKTLTKGFTLIELIIVMAILGILAIGLIAVLDPVEQIRRGQDTGLKNTAIEISRAQDRAFASTSAGGSATYMATIANLQTAGELKSAISTTGISMALTNALGTTKPYACFTPTSKALKLDPNTKYSDSGSATSAPATTCTGAGTISSTCTVWCIQ
jgi:prepilin-type N-terminal cleavage/methylation domain-containing protein